MKPRTTISIVCTAAYYHHVFNKCYLTLLCGSSYSLLVPRGPFHFKAVILTTYMHPPNLFFHTKNYFVVFVIARTSRCFDFSNSLYFRLSTTLLGGPGWTPAVKKFSKRLGWPLRMALHRSTHVSSCSSSPLPVFFFSSAKAPTPPPTPPLRTLQTFHKH